MLYYFIKHMILDMLYLVGFVGFYNRFSYHLGILDCIYFSEFNYNIFLILNILKLCLIFLFAFTLVVVLDMSIYLRNIMYKLKYIMLRMKYKIN